MSEMEKRIRFALDGVHIESGRRDEHESVVQMVLQAARAQGVPMRDLCYLYWSAYHSGHSDTVEGQYTDVVSVDRFDYWKDAVQECLESGDMPGIATPQPADGWTKCSERLPTEADADCEGVVWVTDGEIEKAGGGDA